MIRNLEKHEAWKVLGYPSLDMLFADRFKHYKFSPDDIRFIRDAQRGTIRDAVVAARQAGPTPKPGEIGNGRPRRDGNAISTKGTTVSNTLRRLLRDRPVLFERVDRGELSANAAAIEAGFRKVKTPLEQLKHWWKKCSKKEQREFLTR